MDNGTPSHTDESGLSDTAQALMAAARFRKHRESPLKCAESASYSSLESALSPATKEIMRLARRDAIITKEKARLQAKRASFYASANRSNDTSAPPPNTGLAPKQHSAFTLSPMMLLSIANGTKKRAVISSKADKQGRKSRPRDENALQNRKNHRQEHAKGAASDAGSSHRRNGHKVLGSLTNIPLHDSK